MNRNGINWIRKLECTTCWTWTKQDSSLFRILQMKNRKTKSSLNKIDGMLIFDKREIRFFRNWNFISKQKPFQTEFLCLFLIFTKNNKQISKLCVILWFVLCKKKREHNSCSFCMGQAPIDFSSIVLPHLLMIWWKSCWQPKTVGNSNEKIKKPIEVYVSPIPSHIPNMINNIHINAMQRPSLCVCLHLDRFLEKFNHHE